MDFLSDKRPRIFVQIPSYRDRECQWTVKDLFAKARHPERIFVGICWQFDPLSDMDCFQIEVHPEQVRRVNFHVTQAQGLGWARAQAQALWRGEEFTLQIDSHMRFVADWDERMLAELAACPSQRPVLTIYPACYWPPDELQVHDPSQVVVQAVERFNPSGILQYTCHTASADVPRDSPFLSSGLAGGFVFGSSRMIEDIPPDPELYFEGEEPNLAVRLWTHGYDLFSPREPLIYHYYRRIESRRPWNDSDHRAPNKRSLARMRMLFEPRGDDAKRLGRHGLGLKRSLEDYELFAGVDFRAKTVASFAYHFPFFYTDEVTAVLIGLAPLAPAADAQLFVLNDEGILYCARSRAFYRLSAVATFCWCAIEEGLTISQIVDGLAHRADLTRPEARQRVHNQICHWQHLGALQEGTDKVRGTFPDATAPPPTLRWRPRPPPDVTPIDRHYRVLGSLVRVRSYGAFYDELAQTVLAHLPQADDEDFAVDEVGHVVQMMGVGPYHFLIRDDLYPPASVENRSALASLLLQCIEEVSREAPSSLLLLRAVLLERAEGSTLVLADTSVLVKILASLEGSICGSNGGVAERVVRTHPELLGETWVQLQQESCQARYAPKAIVVSGSWFEQYRERFQFSDALPRFSGFSQPEVRFLPFAVPASSRSWGVSKIVALELGGEYATSAGSVRPMTTADMLTRLINASAPGSAPSAVAEAAALIGWLDQLPCFEITAADHGSAVALLAQQ
jgi:hypothetical protein